MRRFALLSTLSIAGLLMSCDTGKPQEPAKFDRAMNELSLARPVVTPVLHFPDAPPLPEAA